MESKINFGLEGVPIAESKISYVNGQKEELIYRGYWADELALSKTFEEVLYLILFEDLPDKNQLRNLKDKLISLRKLSPELKAIIRTIPAEVSYMAVLRSILSLVAVPEQNEYPPTVDLALQLVAIAPTILAYRHANLSGKKPIEPHAALGHVENFLYMINGRKMEAALVHALTTYMVLTMDHEINASTYTARVV